MPQVPPELYGPFAGLVLATLAVVALWRSHEKSDAKTQERLDRSEARDVETIAALRDIREGLELNADATERLARTVGRQPREPRAKP